MELVELHKSYVRLTLDIKDVKGSLRTYYLASLRLLSGVFIKNAR